MRNVTLKELKKNLTKTGTEFFDMKDVLESNTLRFKGVKKRWAYDRNDTWSEAMIEEMIFQWSIIMIGVYNYDLESGFSGMTVDEVELMDEADLVKLSREFGELMVNTILQGLAVKIQVGDLPFDRKFTDVKILARSFMYEEQVDGYQGYNKTNAYERYGQDRLSLARDLKSGFIEVYDLY